MSEHTCCQLFKEENKHNYKTKKNVAFEEIHEENGHYTCRHIKNNTAATKPQGLVSNEK